MKFGRTMENSQESPVLNKDSVKKAIRMIKEFMDEEYDAETLMEYDFKNALNLMKASQKAKSSEDESFKKSREYSVDLEQSITHATPKDHDEAKFEALIKKLQELEGSQLIEKNFEQIGCYTLQDSWRGFVEEIIDNLKEGERYFWAYNLNAFNTYCDK